MKSIFIKIKTKIKTFIQRIFLTMQLYGENGLANHAAACAYGFLFSIAPMLLLVSFLIFILFKPTPAGIAVFFDKIPFFDGIFDEKWFASDLFSGVNPGISGIISMLSILWAARILAVSIQRGLKIVFPVIKNRNPLSENLVMIVIEAVVIIFILIIILGSRTAMRLYKLFDFFQDISFFQIITSQTGNRLFYILILGLVSYFLYLFVPVKTPRKFSAFQGALFCVIAYSITAITLGAILDISRYNFLYGALGNMIILLVNIFFFFNYFFMGAQFIFVTDFFDALYFIKLRQINLKTLAKNNSANVNNQIKSPDLIVKLFHFSDGNANKNIKQYEKDEIIISQGDDTGEEIYYLLEGEVDVSVSSVNDNKHSVGVLEAGNFFGEMRHLISEYRCATVSAKTNVTVFVISPFIFDEILKYDTSIDRYIIEHMSRRLKDITEQIQKEL